MNNNDYLEYRKKVLERRIEREQQEAKSNIKIIKRDFFDSLPQAVVEVLHSITYRWKQYDWFEEAWDKYRDHVLDATSKNLPIKAPGYIFNEYINEQIKEDFLKADELDKACCECCDRPLAYSDKDLDELFHHGIKGQKWGVRRYQNADGTLTDEGKVRYGGDSVDELKGKGLEKYKKDVKSSGKAQTDILKEGQNIANTLASRMNETRGSKRVNKKNYKNLSDEELRKRVNRLSLERQYGDLTGDAKYVMSGKEVTREILQSVGATLGIAASAVGIAIAIKQLRG